MTDQENAAIAQDLDDALESLADAREKLGEDESPVGQVAAAQQLTIHALEEMNDGE